MTARTALLLIDVQANMFDPASPVADALALQARLGALLGRARAAGTPVVFVRNTGVEGDPDIPGTPGWELQTGLTPVGDELLLDKTTCNTFESTPLADELAARGVTSVVIAGLQSDWCIRQTTAGALALGYGVTLVSDGHSTYDGKARTAAESTAAVNAEFAGRVALVAAGEVEFTG